MDYGIFELMHYKKAANTRMLFFVFKDTCIENSQAQLSQELVHQLLSCISSGDCSEQLSITIVNNYGRFQGAM